MTHRLSKFNFQLNGLLSTNTNVYARFRAPQKSNITSFKDHQKQPLSPVNNISKFYQDSNIFVTGGTGFVGKSLLEKLLRSCDIANVYVLMRSKSGLNVQQRLETLFESPVFEKLKNDAPELLKKIKVVSGDVALPNLGISESDRSLLEKRVSVVFHSAATIKANGDLKQTVQINTNGTKQIAELCSGMKGLKSFVYVSSAYSNSDRRHIKELVYNPPYNPDFIIDCMQNLPQDVTSLITKQLIGNFANTYTFSKILAEKIVSNYAGSLPLAIVRPSLVNSSWKEPFPGLLNSSSTSLTGAMIGVAQGTTKSGLISKDVTLDIIPVDVVVNTLIATAWYTSTVSSTTQRVYNCTSGQINRLNWGKFGDLFIKHIRNNPSQHILSYPSFKMTSNRKIHNVKKICLQHTQAYLMDMYLLCRNKKPKMVTFCKKIDEVLSLAEFLVLHEIIFDVSSFKELAQAVKKAEDGKNFDIDMSVENGFDWDSYLKDYVLGIRQYVLKDDISNLKQARTKLNRLYWATKAIQVLGISLILGFTLW